MATAAQATTSFPALLTQFKGEIARALPRHIDADRMLRIALTAFRRVPKLSQCDPRSVFASVIQASQLGLEPDLLGRAYLVPYGNECQFIPGWKGLTELVHRSGSASVWTGAVHAGDQFEYMLGDSPFCKHAPADNEDILTHVYAIGRVKGAEWPVIEVWSKAKVEKHRDRYNKVGKRHYSYEHFEMYARKVVLLQVLKYMPASPELSQALDLDNAASTGHQGLTIDNVIDGTWSPPSPEEDKTGAKNGHQSYDDASFAEHIPEWQKAIDGRRRTPQQIVAMISGTYELTPEQKATILALKPTAKKPEEEKKAEVQEKDSGAPQISFELVKAKLTSATEIDVLDAHADLIGEIADPEQRKEAAKLYKERRAELEA